MNNQIAMGEEIAQIMGRSSAAMGFNGPSTISRSGYKTIIFRCVLDPTHIMDATCYMNAVGVLNL